MTLTTRAYPALPFPPHLHGISAREILEDFLKALAWVPESDHAPRYTASYRYGVTNMTADDGTSTSKNLTRELTPEEAHKKREYHLELARHRTKPCENDPDELDPADSTMATLILPGD